MKTTNFVPEGWNNEITKVNKENINEYLKNQEILQGLVKECDSNYNLHINFENGLNGIIPMDEVEGINVQDNGLPKTNLCTGKVHKFVQFKVKEINGEEVILSRKQVQNEALDWATKELHVGQELSGIVKSIKPYGAFVEIGGGVVGLVHIEDLSVARIKTPYERVKIGQKVNVMVKSINKEQNKIILTHKELFGTWEDNAKKFSERSIVKGRIRETEKNKNGIFVELTPNLVGMAEYKDGYEYGQEVDVYIKKIDKDKKKIKLIIK